MQINKHLLLWSSAGALAALAWAAFSENVLADWRLAQRHVASEVQDLDVRLRQIVVPELGVVDRCVSCHVGMEPGSEGLPGDAIYGKHVPVHHEPSEMGCTVCHGGQGRATTKDDAHGRVPHWPEPMIPVDYAPAGCGTCHTHLSVPNEGIMTRGQALVERYDCLACHRIDNRGGTLRPGGTGGGEGPDLSTVGLGGFRPDWYAHHLAERARPAVPGDLPWKAAFGPIPDADRPAIDTYLRSRSGVPELVEAKALFHTLGCRGCHKVHGVGGDDGPDLSRAGQRDPALTNFGGVEGERTIPNWYAEHFVDPARVVPGSRMPALGLTDDQIDTLVLYLLSLRRAEAPEAFWPRDRVRALRLDEREFATDGATLYGTFCSACHGPNGEGMRYAGFPPFPAVANADFLAVASDAFLVETIEHGRPGRRMPAWGQSEGGLRPKEVAAVVRHLRALAGGVRAEPDPKPGRWVQADAEGGRELYEESCASCHGPDGLGAEGVALNNAVLLRSATDTYLVETIRRGRRGTTMEPFAKGSPVRRALSPGEIESIVAFLRRWEEGP